MRFKFSGDFAALEQFADQVRRAPKALTLVNEQLAEETIALIHEGMAAGHDPYGKPYPAPKLRGGAPLQDTGRLKTGWHARVAGKTSFTVGNPTTYASYVQEGTGLYGPRRRRIYPTHARALRIPVRGATGGLSSAKGFVFRHSVAGMAPRRMVPDANNLPSHWRDRYHETALDVLTQLFR